MPAVRGNVCLANSPGPVPVRQMPAPDFADGQGDLQEKDTTDNYLDDRHLGKENDRLATVGMGVNGKGGGRIRTDDNGFAIRRLGPLGYAANVKLIYLQKRRESRGLRGVH